MNLRERTLLKNIYKDCIKLRQKNELTEFGEGQLALCQMLLKKSVKRGLPSIITSIF